MKTNYAKSIQASLASIALLCASVSQADQQISTAFSLPIQVNAVVDETGCENHPGPTITLSGAISLGGFNARVIFMNNAMGTHTATVVREFDVTLLPAGSTIEIPKQPVKGGVGGNPHIYLQFHDGNGNDLSQEFYLGRCVQGLKVSADLLQEVMAHTGVHADGCSNRKGPFITLGGDLVLGGVHARIIFRNNVKGTHTAEETRDISIVAEGSKIVLPKQPLKGGVGGNPIISIQLLHGDGTPIDEPVVLGRCVQL